MLKALRNIFSTKEIVRSEEALKLISQECERFKLYQIHSCTYCIRVRKAAKRLGLNIEQRDININKDWEQELISHGGKRQVPCLRINNPDGSTIWKYESIDIINYLTDKFKE